jgi:hypothetical protein
MRHNQARASAGARCFHCGLPVPQGLSVPTLDALGESREFCCHGCHAVCKAIVDAGLDDYYRHRTDPAVSASRELVGRTYNRTSLALLATAARPHCCSTISVARPACG